MPRLAATLCLLLVCYSAQAQTVVLTAADFRIRTPAQDESAPAWTESGGVLYSPETADPSIGYGLTTTGPLAVSLPLLEAGTYRAFVVMRGPTGQSDSILLSIFGDVPEGAGGQGISGGRSWTMVDTYTTRTPITLTLPTTGRHAVTISAREPGVEVAAVVLTRTGPPKREGGLSHEIDP